MVSKKTMLNIDSLTNDVTISAKGVATDNVTGKSLLKGVTGIYSSTPNTDFEGMINISTTRIKGNDLVLKLQNNKTITILGYFTNNAKSTFKYAIDGDGNVTNLISKAFIQNKNLYNEYNLATNHDADGLITKTTITGTSFNDTFDLSGFSAEQLKTTKGAAIKSLTINAGAGNDNIVGSIVNDVITGGAGENTLDYSEYKGNNIKFGTDTYKITSKEILNIKLGNLLDDNGNSFVSYSKNGNNIQLKVYGNKAETEEISYQKTTYAGDTVATKYTQIVKEYDTTATQYTYTEVEANNHALTAEEATELGDTSLEGKFKKEIKLYVRNSENNGWELAAEQPAATYEDAAVEAVAPSYVKYVNGNAQAAVDVEPDNFSDEGKFNTVIKTYSRNNNNSDWSETPETTIAGELADATHLAEYSYKKSVNGADATDYIPTEEDTFADEAKFNHTTTVYNYIHKDEEYRALENTDLVTGLSAINNTTVSKEITTTELSASRTNDGFTVVAGKLYKEQSRDITQEDLKDGLIFVEGGTVKETEESEARAITQEDLKDGLTIKGDDATKIDITINQTLVQEDLAEGWTLLNNSTSASRTLVANTDLTAEAQAVYDADKGILTTPEGYYWVQSSQEKTLDGNAQVSTPDSYVRIVDGTPSSYTWDDENKPNDMGTQLTGKILVNEDVLGNIIINTIGTQNNLATVNFVDNNGNNIANLFDQLIEINGIAGGKLVGTKGNDLVELGRKAATLSATAGHDIIISNNNTALTFTDTRMAVQDLVDYDVYNTNGYVEDGMFTYSNMAKNYGVSFDGTKTTLIDKTKAKYNVLYTSSNTSLAAKSNNLLYVDTDSVAGATIATNTGNDVVIFGSSAENVKGNVESTTDLTGTKLVWVDSVLKYERIAAQEAQYRDITEEDLVNGLIFVDSNHVKDNEADEEARTITANDIVEATRPNFVEGHGIQTAAAIEQVTETLTAENANAAINNQAGFVWDTEAGTIKTFTKNQNIVNYTSGNDAVLGSNGNEAYNVVTLNKNTQFVINDQGGADYLNFTRQNFSDMTIFFNVDSNKKTDGHNDLSIISNDIVKNAKNLTAFVKGTGKGGVVINNFFNENNAITDNEGNLVQEAFGDGYIEEVKVSGNNTAGSLDTQIRQITENVAAWLSNNGNYDSAIDVVNTGNAADIQSLIQCYTAGTTSAIAV